MAQGPSCDVRRAESRASHRRARPGALLQETARQVVRFMGHLLRKKMETEIQGCSAEPWPPGWACLNRGPGAFPGVHKRAIRTHADSEAEALDLCASGFVLFCSG